MGMFDHVKCLYPLPDSSARVQNETFQTKDLENLLDTYIITKNGRLIHKKVTYEVTPEKDRPWKKDPELKDHPFANMVGMMRPIETKEIDTEYHGWLQIYTIIDDEWVEFEIKFTDGELVSIKRVYREFGK